MIYDYGECMEIWKSDYRINAAIENGSLFQIERGIYSDSPDVSTLEVITKKYPKSIVTMETAFYYHGLTDVIPDRYWLATEKSARGITDKRVKQVFVRNDIFDAGVIRVEKNGAVFKMYDKERMLIELIRYKNKMPYDYYKEIVLRYRDIIHTLDIERIQQYAEIFPCSRKISEALEKEVF